MKEDDRRLSGAYAADAVNDDERAAHEALVREDPELAEETRSLTEAVSELSKISEQAPPERLRADLLNAIKSVRPLPPLAEDPPRGTLTADQAAQPGFAAEPGSAAELDRAGERDEAAGAEVDETELPVNLGRRRARRRGAWLGAIAAAAAAALVTVVVVLGQRDTVPANQAASVISASDVSSQTATVDDWSATLYLSRAQGKAVISSDQMPDAPSGKDFQVWLIHDDESISSAGVMPRTDGTGQQYVVDGVASQVAAIAVSEEPAGGSDQPTTAPFLVIDLA